MMGVDFRIISSLLPPGLTLLGLAYFVLTDKYIRKAHRKAMLIAVALVATLIAQNVLGFYASEVYSNQLLRLLNTTYGYLVQPVLIVVLHYIVGGNRKFIPAWCIVGFNTLVYTVNLFYPIAFEIAVDDGKTHFIRMPLGYTCYIICILLLVEHQILTLRVFGRRDRFAVVPFCNMLLIFGAIILDTNRSVTFPVSFLTVAIVMNCVSFYIWIHLQLVEQYEESLKEKHRMEIMVSQIKPHFLFNTIATFKALCRSDPGKAADVADKFGQYLRENLDLLNSAELIPLEKELTHTRVYADIEMVRFENIRVDYDIADTDFMLPALTIQPIVENAIRHGVRVRDEGIVCVSTRRADGFHEIVISDNGVGFDVSALEHSDGTHIGLPNVRERIEKLCGGTVTAASEIGKGTAVTIRIPETGRTK